MIDPADLLELWFADTRTDAERAAARKPLWFGSDPSFDGELRARCGDAVRAAFAGELDAWRRHAGSNLALVLLLDQLPRNLYRGSARAFAGDGAALATAVAAIERGDLARLTPVEQVFLTMPCQHSESAMVQRRSVHLLEGLAAAASPEWGPFLAEALDFHRRHLELIERFGRFPHRNQTLGRASTPAEVDFLAQGGERFGQ